MVFTLLLRPASPEKDSVRASWECLRVLSPPASTTNKNPSNNGVNIVDDSTLCEDITGLTINGQESMGVTTLVQEACELVSVMPGAHKDNLLPPVSASMQDLISYLARPRIISEGVLPLTRTNFFNFTPSGQTILQIWFPNLFNRLLGTFAFRATVVYTFQVCATPFHTGLYSLAAQFGIKSPSAPVLASRPETSTNCHSVRLDLSTSTQVVLRVPYFQDAECCVTAGVYGSVPLTALWHRVALNALTTTTLPANLAASTYNLYVHLEDVQLLGAGNATIASISTQSSRVLAPRNREIEDDAKPFSSAAMSASKTLRFLARGVPALSSLFAPPIWALNAAAGALRSFGYAKPTIQDPPIKANTIYTAQEHNVDLPSAVVVVGPFSSQDLAVGPHFSGTDVDEMSIAYVASRWSQCAHVIMTTSDAANKPIWAAENSPSSFWFRDLPYSATAATINYGPLSNISAVATANSFQPTSLFFAAAAFQLWRGAIRYRFTFVKSKMHAGRVMVSYQPTATGLGITNAFSSSAPTSVANGPEVTGGSLQPFGYTAIFDLKDTNVFEFEVPFMARSTWLPFGNETGYVTMSVLDPLIASSTVANSISLLVEVCGGSDFEVAVPTTPLYTPHERGTVRLQSSKVLSTLVPDANQWTVGHKVTSFKQLISIPHTIQLPNLGANVDTTIAVMPWFYRQTPSPLVPSTGAPGTSSFSFGAYVASAYAYVRGGTDAHVYAANINNMQVIPWLNPNPTGTNNNTNDVAFNRPVSNVSRIFSNPDAPMHFRYPMFLRTARMESAYFNAVPWSIPSFGSASTTPSWNNGVADAAAPEMAFMLSLFNRSSGSTTPMFLNRNASDDAAACCYQGPPPMLLFPSPATATSYDPQTVPYTTATNTVAAASAIAVDAALPAAFSTSRAAITAPSVEPALPVGTHSISINPLSGEIADVVNREVPLMGPPPSPSYLRSKHRAALVSSILENNKAT